MEEVKVIRIMLAASEEMHHEILKFSSLVEHLNEVLEPRGIRLERTKWDPTKKGSIEDFIAQLEDCEMCMILYWRELAGNSAEELDSAYLKLKKGDNPRNLYVFFKEPSADITRTLKEFKDAFCKKYGHFFCTFENADTMNLHFILQFAAYQNDLSKDLISISANKVVIGGEKFIDLANIPFSALNKKVQEMQNELGILNARLIETREKNVKDLGCLELEDEIHSLRTQIDNLDKELENYQTHLYNTALYFVKESAKKYSDRISQARDYFERGFTTEADELLNLYKMDEETRKEEEILNQAKENLLGKISEYRMKTHTVMTNTKISMPDRFATACKAFETAIRISKEIVLDPMEIADTLFDYAYLLQQFEETETALAYYLETLNIYNSTGGIDEDGYLSNVASIFNNITHLQKKLRQYTEAEENCNKALAILRRLAEKNKKAYLPSVAKSLINLAELQRELKRFKEAEKSYAEALKIKQELDPNMLSNAEILCRIAEVQHGLRRREEAEETCNKAMEIFIKLTEEDKEIQLPEAAALLNSLGSLYDKLKKHDKAENAYMEELAIYLELAEVNINVYLPRIAMTFYNMGNQQRELGRYLTAEDSYNEALETYRRASKKDKDRYLPNIAMVLNNLGNVQQMQQLYIEAEKSYSKALEIRRKLAQEHEEVFIKDLANTLYNIVSIQEEQGKIAEAINNYKELLAIHHKFAEKDEERYLPLVAKTSYNIGALHTQIGQPLEAVAELRKALNAYYTLTKKYNIIFLQEATSTLFNTGALLQKFKEYAEAEEVYKEGLDMFIKMKECDKNSNDKLLHNIAFTQYCIATIQNRFKRLVEAEENYRKALIIFRKLAEDNKNTYLPNVAMILEYIAAIKINSNNMEDAKRIITEALEIYEELEKAQPDKYQNDINRFRRFLESN